MSRTLRLGTRGSRLAIIQSTLVADALRAHGADVELVTVVTAGDVRAPDTAWGEGAFVGALERRLLAGGIDLAVHSAKDLPIDPETDLVIAAYPERADPRDALVLPAGTAAHGAPPTLSSLPTGMVVGTDSPRRTGFLRAARPDLLVVPLHGNVDTRLARLDGGEVDALVLAVAGLSRLGRQDRISAILPAELVPPAPGQGAMAVQVRAGDAALHALGGAIDHPATRCAVTAEREVLHRTGGGCRAPLGALGTITDGTLHLLGGAVDPSGADARFVTRSGPAGQASNLAADVAALLTAGRRTWPRTEEDSRALA